MSMQPDPRDGLQDPRLAQWYRESGGLEPSAALDQAILAAAHREVDARPRTAGSVLRRGRVPLSLAAVVVLSVTVVTLVTEHDGDLAELRAPAGTGERALQPPGATRTPPERIEGAAGRPALEPIPGPTEGQTSATGSLAAGGSGAVRSAPDAEPGRHEDARPSASSRNDTAPAAASVAKKAQALESAPAAPSAAAPTMAPGQVSPPVASPFGSQFQDSPVAERQSSSRSQAAAKRMPPGGEVSQLLKTLDDELPERWLEKIEELRRAGRNAEADELLAAFRKRFPEHPGAAVR